MTVPVSSRAKRPVSDRSAALCRWFARLLKSDSARICRPGGGDMFLIIGYRRNTRDDPGVWVDGDGLRKDWDYTQEATVASGRTVRELIASAKHYQRLTGMTMLEYLRELFPRNPHLTEPGAFTLSIS